MADMELVRVIALDEEASGPEAGQYLLVDTAEGTKKMQVDNLLQAARLSDDAKTALLDCFAHVAWADEHGQDYYDALEDALQGRVLPSEYREVEYLESTGTQYIQTNILSMIPFEINARFLPISADAPVMGAIDRSDTNNSRFFLLGVTGGTGEVSNLYCANRFGSGQGYDDIFGHDVYWCVTHNDVSFTTPTRVISGIRYSSVYGKANIYINDGVAENSMDVDAPYPLGAPILLFIKPTSMGGVSMRLYDIKMYAGGEMVFDGVPCVRVSDSEPGLYDLVHNEFYTNAGTGDFVIPSGN